MLGDGFSLIEADQCQWGLHSDGGYHCKRMWFMVSSNTAMEATLEVDVWPHSAIGMVASLLPDEDLFSIRLVAWRGLRVIGACHFLSAAASTFA